MIETLPLITLPVPLDHLALAGAHRRNPYPSS
jgi:hypothetical protein